MLAELASLKSKVTLVLTLQWRMKCSLAWITTTKVLSRCSRRYNAKFSQASNSIIYKLANQRMIRRTRSFKIRCQSILPVLLVVLRKDKSLQRRVEGSQVWLPTVLIRPLSTSQKACVTIATTGMDVKVVPPNANTLKGWTTRKECAKTATSTHTIKKRDSPKKSSQSPNSNLKDWSEMVDCLQFL